MKWLSNNYTWVFSGVGVALILLVLEWFKRRSRSPDQSQGGLTAQGSKVENSPQAQGSGIIQNWGNINFGEQPNHQPEPKPKREPEPEPELEPTPNLQIVGARTLWVRAGMNDELYESQADEGFTALVVDITNDARKGASNLKAVVKATLVYKDLALEVAESLRVVMAGWLGQVGGKVRFEVDSAHSVILGVAFNDQVAVPSWRLVPVGYGSEGWISDARPLKASEAVVTVRLTDITTGDVYCEGHFDLELGSRLRISQRSY